MLKGIIQCVVCGQMGYYTALTLGASLALEIHYKLSIEAARVILLLTSRTY